MNIVKEFDDFEYFDSLIEGRNYSFQKLESLLTQQIILSISGSK